MIRVLDGCIDVDGRQLRLSPKELSLLALLGLARGPVDGETVCEALWPEASLEAAASSLRVYVHRVRKKIGDANCIEVAKGRYRVRESVRTDLARIAKFAATPPARPSSVDIQLALHRYQSLASGPPGFLVDLPVFSSLNAQINDLLDAMEQWLQTARDRVGRDDAARIDAVFARELVS